MLVRLRDCVQVCCRCPDDGAQCTMRIFYREQRVDDSTVLEPCIVHVIRLKTRTVENDKDTEKHSTTKKLQCTMPSCRSTSELHQIIIRTRDRCACRAHEFSIASGHSTQCWACRPVYRDTNSVSSLRLPAVQTTTTLALLTPQKL